MSILILLGLLLVATRPTRSVTTEPGHVWRQPLGSGQAKAATRIASSTISGTMSSSHEWAMLLDETKKLHFPGFEYSLLESNWLQGDSLLEFDFSNIDPVDQFGESSSMNEVEWHLSPSSEIGASHISIDSQQLGQEGENLDCLIDPNRLPIDLEILLSKDFPENFVPANRDDHQFGDSSFRISAVQSMSHLSLGLLSSSQDWTPSTRSNRDASCISIDGKTFDCLIENTINSKNQPVDVREKLVLEPSPKQTHKKVKFRKFKYFVGLRMLYRHLNWDLDEVKDYDSLCVFLKKKTTPEQVEFHNSEAMMELLLIGKSRRDKVEVGQNNIDIPDTTLIVKATSTLEKLILISNFVLKLVSCRRSLCSISPNVIECLKRTCIPVLQCLVKCCDKDMDLFQRRWGKLFRHHCFGLKCCPGRGSNHNTCGYLRTKFVRNPDNRDKDPCFLELKALRHAILTSKTVQEKLNMCQKFSEKYLSSYPKDRTTLRQYYNQTPKAILGCFVHHCGQNLIEWIRKWGPQFAHAEFKRRKCQGLKSIECGSIKPPFDIPARHDLPYQLTRDLLPALSKIREEYDQFMFTKTESMKSPNPCLIALIRTSRPVYHCLHRHCAGSVEEFVRRWGESVHYTKFSRDYCPGTGRMESDICQYEFWSSQD